MSSIRSDEMVARETADLTAELESGFAKIVEMYDNFPAQDDTQAKPMTSDEKLALRAELEQRFLAAS
jgi:hypothetical protein